MGKNSLRYISLYMKNREGNHSNIEAPQKRSLINFKEHVFLRESGKVCVCIKDAFLFKNTK